MRRTKLGSRRRGLHLLVPDSELAVAQSEISSEIASEIASKATRDRTGASQRAVPSEERCLARLTNDDDDGDMTGTPVGHRPPPDHVAVAIPIPTSALAPEGARTSVEFGGGAAGGEMSTLVMGAGLGTPLAALPRTADARLEQVHVVEDVHDL